MSESFSLRLSWPELARKANRWDCVAEMKKIRLWVGDQHTNATIQLLIAGTSRAVAFNGDGSQMFSHGGDGQVYVWDMATRACVHTFADEGCFNGTALSVSKDSRLLATGYAQPFALALLIVFRHLSGAKNLSYYCGVRMNRFYT